MIVIVTGSSDRQSNKSHKELSAIIKELPYKGGWRFGDEKRCLPGTREDFLEHITNWVENPNSKRGLVLLGQAGTGKSSIAREVARRFEKTCLASYFTFLRKEGSKDDVYQLFTTIARDLSDRHSAFRNSLGRVVKNNSFLCASREYGTLFGRLLVEPLRALPLPGPILIVIDALDEWRRNRQNRITLISRPTSHRPPFRIPCTRYLEAREWYRACVLQSIIYRHPLHG